jgi:7,8-dihydropterin-6-yl-methyl-4-(beta-D-ribofuranosyl)aminobenzene 5'-phosphate synthase
MRRLLIFLQGMLLYPLHVQRVREAERICRESAPPPMNEFGATHTLRILPLVDWHVSRRDLAGEAGVSYLIRTDHSAILFDVGANERKENVSPLERNLRSLGVSLDEVDHVFISHLHHDHVGGRKWVARRSFSLGKSQTPLPGKRVWVPTEMSYPGLSPILARKPAVIARGVATMGAIPRQLFTGLIEEQALAVNVEGKGLVLIVGCGHQTLPRLLERADRVFGIPVYGVVGGLHYPVPDGRTSWLGMNVQRVFASGKGPLRPVTWEEMEGDIDALAARRPGFVSLSGHDSSDAVIEHFRRRFGAAYRDLRVGEEIAA